ncbi:MAG TPA: hypothetical protein VK518_20860 [Puia sp.]|nr:hypothetical protein [Puia sp.]
MISQPGSSDIIPDPPFFINKRCDDLNRPQQNGKIPDQASKRGGRFSGLIVENLKSQDTLANTLPLEKILVEEQGENNNVIKAQP